MTGKSKNIEKTQRRTDLSVASCFPCDICNMVLNSQEQLAQHFSGIKHLKKLKERGEESKYKPPKEDNDTSLYAKLKSSNKGKSSGTGKIDLSNRPLFPPPPPLPPMGLLGNKPARNPFIDDTPEYRSPLMNDPRDDFRGPMSRGFGDRDEFRDSRGPIGGNFRGLMDNRRPMSPDFRGPMHDIGPLGPDFRGPMDNRRPMSPDFRGPMDEERRPLGPDFRGPMDDRRPMGSDFRGPMDDRRPISPDFRGPMRPDFRDSVDDRRPRSPDFRGPVGPDFRSPMDGRSSMGPGFRDPLDFRGPTSIRGNMEQDFRDPLDFRGPASIRKDFIDRHEPKNMSGPMFDDFGSQQNNRGPNDFDRPPAKRSQGFRNPRFRGPKVEVIPPEKINSLPLNPVIKAVMNNALGNLPLKRKAYDGRCDSCNVNFTDPLQEQQHFNGKKHAKKMRLLGFETNPEGASPVVKASGFNCLFCKVELNSLEQLEQHEKGAKHHKKVAQAKAEAKGEKEEDEDPEKEFDLNYVDF